MGNNGFGSSWSGARLALRFVWLLAWLISAQASSAGSNPILAVRQALRSGDSVKLDRSLAAAHGHVLEPYVEYWSLSARIGQSTSAEIRAFLEAHDGTLLAEDLRAKWLKQLAGDRNWEDFDREYPRLAVTDRELQCNALQGRLRRNDAGALDAIRDLWLNVDLPPACAAPLATLYAANRVTPENAWERLRVLIEDGALATAGATAGFLPAEERPDALTLEQVVEAPGVYLARQDIKFPSNRTQQQLAAAALARFARSDPSAAADRFGSLQARLDAALRQFVFGHLGWQAARRHQSEALTWYQAAGDTALSNEQLAWKARAALRAADWRQVLAAVEAMPPQLSTQSDWIYWRARAFASLGRGNEAQLLFRSVSGKANFYGNLADEELGHRIDVPPPAVAPTWQELAEVSDQPGIRRAFELHRIGLRREAVREWNWVLRGRGDRFLLAAAEYARRNQLFDRAIAAADRTQDEHDFALRFLAPYRSQVAPKAQALDLDPAWVYGLIRQESRFVTDARSGVGASGLMQLMPATARWLERKLGMKRVSERINELATNIALGTNYLKLVLEGLDDQPLLASAAYNAGPGRAKRWRGDRALEGAIYAETIPFRETRNYVKKVMSNAVYYAALFEGKPQSLKARLGIVRSRDNAAVPLEPIASNLSEVHAPAAIAAE